MSTPLDHQRRLIEANLDHEMNTFVYALDRGIIARPLLERLVSAIVDVHNSDLKEGDRLRLAARLWELAYHIHSVTQSHLDPMDVAKVNGTSDDELRALNKLLFYLCNWFTYAKPMDASGVKLDTWV